MPYRLLGCFRGGELHGGFALGLVGHRAADRRTQVLRRTLASYTLNLMPNMSRKSPTTKKSEVRLRPSLGVSLIGSNCHLHRKLPICSPLSGKDLGLNCTILIDSLSQIFHPL